MFRKFMERRKLAIRNSRLSSRIFFGLTVLMGLAWALSGFDDDLFFLLTGLMGVIWVSIMALHSNQFGKGRRLNPFTPLIMLCIALFIGCYIYSISGRGYNPESEPIETLSVDIQDTLNANPDLYEHLAWHAEAVFQEVQHNLIVTDENDHVLYALNSWRSGNNSVFYPLIVADNDLVVLMGDNEQVTGTATRDSRWVDGRFIHTHSPLTRTGTVQQTTDEETPLITRDQPDTGNASSDLLTRDITDSTTARVTSPEPVIPTEQPASEEPTEPTEPTLTDREQLVQLYFPDFGQYINQFFYRLAHDPLLLGEETGWADLSFFAWQGETVLGLDREQAAHGDTALRGLVSELNALTESEREALKEYVAWYDSARTASRMSNGEYVYIRLLKSEDGTRNAYLFYQYDGEVLNPRRREYHMDQQRRGVFANFALCMIPAVIVFLAFWVFVDAKKRGQNMPALWAMLTLIGNVVTWIIYMMLRPQMTVGVNGKAAPRGVCPLCGSKLKDDFIACPGCGILLRNRCKNCGRALENDWSFCPYCTSAIVSGAPADPVAPPADALVSEPEDAPAGQE